jgi:hypothetical protein
VPISELVFGTLTQNRSSLGPSLEFAAIAGTPRIENGGSVAVDFADGRRDRHNIDVRPDGPQPIQEKGQDYSGFGLRSQTPTLKSAQLSLAPARAAGYGGDRIQASWYRRRPKFLAVFFALRNIATDHG